MDPLSYVARLPSMAAVARARQGAMDRAMLMDVERYAAGDFLTDLLTQLNSGKTCAPKDTRGRLKCRPGARIASPRAKYTRKSMPRLSKNSGELERAAALSNFQSCPAACTVGTGRFLRRKIPFSREKIVSLQAPRPKNL